MITQSKVKSGAVRRYIRESCKTQLIHKSNFVDVDLNGRVIDKASKDKTSTEIQGDSRFCGKRFAIGGIIEGHKRCVYCGVWFFWTSRKVAEYLAGGNIDPFNADENIEPLHCNSQHCQDFHEECRREFERRKKIEEEKSHERNAKILRELRGIS